MTDINNLRERVEAAEQRFGLMDEQQRHYSERVIGLIETIETQLQAARGEIEKQIAENRRLGEELAAARSEIEERDGAARRLGEDLAGARGEIDRQTAENRQLVEDLTTARAEVEEQTAENLRMSQENEELRSMLHSLLRSIEQKTHMQTLQNLEERVCKLVTGTGAPAAIPAGAPVPMADTAAVEPAAAIEPAAGAAAIETVIEASEPEGMETVAEADAVIEAADGATGEDGASVILEAAEDADSGQDDGAAEEMAAPESVAEESAAEVSTEDFEPQAVAGDAAPESASDAETAEMEEPAAEGVGEDEAAEAIDEIMADDTGADDSGADDTGATDSTAADSEADDLFAAMTELNAGDTGFLEAMAEGAAPQEPEGETQDVAEATAEAEEPSRPQEAETAEIAVEAAAPTVKEIIRRVGDLARELERAEAARRANRAADEPAARDSGPLGGATPFGRAVNG